MTPLGILLRDFDTLTILQKTRISPNRLTYLSTDYTEYQSMNIGEAFRLAKALGFISYDAFDVTLQKHEKEIMPNKPIIGTEEEDFGDEAERWAE